MRTSIIRASARTLAIASLALCAPAFAQAEEQAGEEQASEADAPGPITISGNITGVTDYRFRGLTQTDEDGALQATVNVNHESGFYVGAFASTIDGSGDTPLLAGYGDVEIDLYGGFTKTFDNGLGVDVGLLYYWYADANSGVNTDFFEPYAALTYTIGPVSTKLGAAYAWGGQDGLDFTASNDDSIYGYFDASIGIPTTPITLKGHIGYTDGSLGLANPDADQTYFDWSVGAEAVGGPFKVGVSYVDTDVTNAAPDSFAQVLGRGATVLGYVGFVF